MLVAEIYGLIEWHNRSYVAKELAYANNDICLIDSAIELRIFLALNTPGRSIIHITSNFASLLPVSVLKFRKFCEFLIFRSFDFERKMKRAAFVTSTTVLVVTVVILFAGLAAAQVSVTRLTYSTETCNLAMWPRPQFTLT